MNNLKIYNDFKRKAFKLCVGVVLGVSALNFTGCSKKVDDNVVSSEDVKKYNIDEMGTVTLHFKNTDELKGKNDKVIFFEPNGELRGIRYSYEDGEENYFEPGEYGYNSDYLRESVKFEIKDSNTNIDVVIDYRNKTISQTDNLSSVKRR